MNGPPRDATRATLDRMQRQDQPGAINPTPSTRRHEPDKTNPAEAAPKGSMKDSANSFFKTLIGAILLALLIRVVLFEAFEIEGPSMEPTLVNGDRVVVVKFFYGLFLPFADETLVSWGAPNLGDVVIVKSPADNIDIVKRVIGLPGDNIQVIENVVYRDGNPLARRSLGDCPVPDEGERTRFDAFGGACEVVEEKLGERSYRTSLSTESPKSTTAAVLVPEGHIFVMGDHRDKSNDSRYFGTVPINRIKGRALAIYWSSGPVSGVRWDRMMHVVQ